MKKHPRNAFGILEDGKTLKLASLMRDAYQVYLMDLQRVDLDNPLYQPQDEYTNFESPPPLEQQSEIGEVTISDFDQDNSTGFKINPWNMMFNSVGLDNGVIAINVNDEHIVRGSNIPETKKAEKAFVRSHLASRQYKAGEWQTSRVSMGGFSQFWLHLGANKLLDLLKFYAKQDNKRLYYQLADSNEIALADFYRVYYLEENLRVLLVYLGMDFRKAYLFDKGNLIDVYPLNITQDYPEAELIFSRVSLAMDNVQQADPEMIVLCGDMASVAVVDYFNQHGAGNTTLLSYPLMEVDSGKSEQFDPAFMAQFALPIALAYKALFPDEPRFTQSNFLPKNLMEAQKPLKFAWHGFLIMIVIFCMALGGTLSYLKGHNLYTKANKTKRNLDHELAVLKTETQEIAQMRAEIQKFGENLEAVRTVLKGKNPWSSLLDTLDRLFQSKPVSWLTNLKKDGARLHVSGVTTNRKYVIDFADALPGSHIQKVANSKIHNVNVWLFEITSDFPEVDWVGQIEKETEEFLAKQKEAEAKIAAMVDTSPPKDEMLKTPEPPTPPKPPVEKKQASKQVITVSDNNPFPPIGSQYLPKLTKKQNQAPAAERDEYNEFVRAYNSGDPINAIALSRSYISSHPKSSLTPVVRWYMAYRYYTTGNYAAAVDALDPLVHRVTELYPVSVLLAARMDYSRHIKRYHALYLSLLQDHPKHPICELVKSDLAQIGEGEGQ
jgi:Tfp pilus assembly protein PilN